MAKQMVFGLGLVGCGAFGRFCVKAYHELAGVRLVAVADTVRPAADAFAREFGVEAHYDARKLIQRADVDIVHIATPPSTHYKLAMQCAAAGKHVLCEKPLATTVADGRKMIRAAAGARTIMPVNFIMRYNRVARTVGEIIRAGVLGELISVRLTNCAADTNLPPTHWFWDRRVSGGIFVEHSVHFFDLHRSWLGVGRVMSAMTASRPRTGQQDRVLCTTVYEGGAIVSQYHGFDQSRSWTAPIIA